MTVFESFADPVFPIEMIVNQILPKKFKYFKCAMWLN